MARVELKYVQRFTDRHGKVRLYFRRAGWPNIPLPADTKSPEFARAYQQALAMARPAIKSPREGPRSMGALIAEYYKSADFLALKPTTQRSHKHLLEPFREEHGHRPVAELRSNHLNIIFHKMADRPAQASNLRKRLRQVLQLGEDLGWIRRGSNPVNQSRKIRYKSDGFPPWSDDDIAAFEKHWPAGSKERLALYLLLYTGQRRSDVVTMSLQDVSGGRISVIQQKTGHKLRIRLHAALKAELDPLPADAPAILLNGYGNPFTAAGFTNWFVEKAKKAGIEGRSPHGLRKAAGRRLAEAGCTAHEIAAILGQTIQMVAHYTRDADQADLADAGIGRLSNPIVKPGVNP